MKKFYSLLTAALVSLVAFNANAFQITVECPENYEMLLLSKYVSGSADTTQNGSFDIEVTSASTNVEFPDDASNYGRYLYYEVAGTDGEVVLEYTIYDEDGTEILTSNPYSATRNSVWIKSDYDGGKIVFTIGKIVDDSSVEVTVVGDPSKINFLLEDGSKSVELVEGTQTISYFSGTTSYIYLMPVNVAFFGEVKVNDETVSPQSGWNPGEYQYSWTVEDGQKIYIDTNLPDTKYDITTTFVGDAATGTTVTVDGVVVEDPTSFQAQFGSNVIFTFDNYAYSINDFQVNGESVEDVLAGWSTSYAYLATAGATFTVDMTKKEFDSKIITYTSGWEYASSNMNDAWSGTFYGLVYIFQTGSGSTLALASNCYSEIPFNALDDNDEDGVLDTYFQLQSQNCTWPADESAEAPEMTLFAYQNDVLVPGDYPSFVTPHNSVLKFFFAKEEPTFGNVTYTLDGFDETVPTIIKDRVVAVDAATGHQSLPGTEIEITAPENGSISSVEANEQPIEAVDGKYVVTVNGDTAITIKGSSTGVDVIEVAPAVVDNAVYNLQGIRLNNTGSTEGLPTGLYIVNGKKVVVK